MGRTAVHYACAYGNENLLNFLLNKGCSPHDKDNKCIKPIHYALGIELEELDEELDN